MKGIFYRIFQHRCLCIFVRKPFKYPKPPIMSDAFFTGTWYGQYFYGASYGEDYEGMFTSFEITLTMKDGVLRGTCVDDPAVFAFKKPATIEGFIDGAFISFVKKYANAWTTDASGRVVEFPNRPSHEIHYTGHFVEDHFEGEWEIINNTHIDAQGNMVDDTLRGTWSMRHAGDF